MTLEEVDEKYKGTTLKFQRYYKYRFTFCGTTKDGNTLVCTYGGLSDDIYRYEVDANCEERFYGVSEWISVELLSPTGETLFNWCD